jgi:DNA segregation ATPase FtsK/SpoIIIE, S-DNA-T family
MATAAARPKDLGPDWRDRLRDSLRRLAWRSWGAVLIGISIAGAIASHSSTDPSFTTAAGGPPENWLGAFGAFASDMALLLFGIGCVLFLPVIGLAGLRLVRLDPPGRTGRALLFAGLAAILVGIALSLTSGSAVSGLPSGWGGAVGLAAANGLDSAVALIRSD